jgi:hypothetical protein
MRQRTPFLVVALCGLALAACPALRAGATPTVPTVPAWAQVQEQTLPADQAQAMTDAAHKFFVLLQARELDGALYLCAPEVAHSDWFANVAGGCASPATTFSLSAPQLVSPDVARIWAYAQRTTTPNTDPDWECGRDLYFVLADRQPLIHLLGPDETPTALDLPAKTADDFNPLDLTGSDANASPAVHELRLEMYSLISSQSPLWSPAADIMQRNVQAWIQAQGIWLTFFQDAYWPVSRFVGMNGASAIVERTVPVMQPPNMFEATYRFRLVQDPTVQDPPEVKNHHKWRIADICVCRFAPVTDKP